MHGAVAARALRLCARRRARDRRRVGRFLAVLALVVGAGWPATLVTDDDGASLGIAILAGALWILAALRARRRRAPRFPPRSRACARRRGRGRRRDQRRGRESARCSTGSAGISTTRPRTRSASTTSGTRTTAGSTSRTSRPSCCASARRSGRCTGARRSSRASTAARWFEDLDREARASRRPLPADPLVPGVPRRSGCGRRWRSSALRDEHLVGAASPVQLRLDDHTASASIAAAACCGRRSGSMRPRAGQATRSGARRPSRPPKQLAAARARLPAGAGPRPPGRAGRRDEAVRRPGARRAARAVSSRTR